MHGLRQKRTKLRTRLRAHPARERPAPKSGTSDGFAPLSGPPMLQVDARAFAAAQLAHAFEQCLVGVLHDPGGQKIIGAGNVESRREARQA